VIISTTKKSKTSVFYIKRKERKKEKPVFLSV